MIPSPGGQAARLRDIAAHAAAAADRLEAARVGTVRIDTSGLTIAAAATAVAALRPRVTG